MKTTINPIKIDLSEYIHSGEGANGESFFHRIDPSVMMKLYNPGAPLDVVLAEYEMSHKVFQAGLPVPQPGDLVTDGTRIGLRFRRIPGKVSFARAIGDQPEKVEEYARRFARLCKRFHAMHLDKTLFPDVKKVDLKMLEANPYFTPEEKKKVAAFIESVPDSDAPYHGDLQFGNAVFGSDGSEYFIDLGDFGCGHPYLDLGMVALCSIYNSEEFVREAFHMSLETARQFWEFFVKEYFGEDASIAEVEAMLRPYAGLKVLIIERNSGMYFPQFHALLDQVLQ